MSTTILPVLDTERWHHSALCAQTDPEVFFPESGRNATDAKRVCRRCPVQAECLADALAHHDQFGVWGGLSAKERRPHAMAAVEWVGGGAK